MIYFTICSKNFLSYALLLGKRLAKLYPESEFYIYLADKIVGFDPSELPFNIVPAEELGMVDFEGMIKRYNISEFNTSIKPYCFLDLYARHPNSKVVYFDPDIYPVDRFVELDNLLDTGSEIVLTPHILSNLEVGGFVENNFLKMGIYNLGFLGTKHTKQTESLMRWWGRKLETQCTIDISNGLFVDQKWAGFFPAFIEKTSILRHPGYNVAYWNLHNRSIKKKGDKYFSNGLPLRFTHFSGIDIHEKIEISRHYKFFKVANAGAFGELITAYRNSILEEGYDYYQTLDYNYFTQPLGDVNLHAVKTQRKKTKTNQVAPKSINNYLLLNQFSSRDQYLKWKKENKKLIELQRNEELNLMQNSGDIISFDGYDYLFAKPTTYRSSYLYSYDKDIKGNPIPNWREHVTSDVSGFQNRIRASIHIFFQEFEPSRDAEIYMTEQKTVLFDWMSVRFNNLTGSEFLGFDFKPGQIDNGIRNENIEDLSFYDNHFDYILSFDVFEHVPFYKKGLSEIYRCLKPGGYFIFSIPPNNMDDYENTTRAVLNDDFSITHYTEPEYHGNPVDLENGSLCFRYYGWKLLDEMKEMGYSNPFIYRYWSKKFGYLGPDQILFIAQKPLNKK